VKRRSVRGDLWRGRIEFLVDNGDARDFARADLDGGFGCLDAGVVRP
jgi:hypothetical protein